MTEQFHSLRENILSAIKRGEVAMRPKWHFILRTVLIVLGLFIAGLLAVYLASMAVFLMKVSGGWFGPTFGPSGMRTFFFSVPWVLVGASTGFIVVLELLARKTEVARRTPLLFSAVGVIALVVIGAIVVDRAAVHPLLMERVRRGEMPMMRGMYAVNQRDDIVRGVILEKNDDQFVIQDPNNKKITIIISAETRMPPVWVVEPGEAIVALGEMRGDEFIALGIRPVEPMRFERRMRDGLRRERGVRVFAPREDTDSMGTGTTKVNVVPM
jgi:hypothetical protein